MPFQIIVPLRLTHYCNPRDESRDLDCAQLVGIKKTNPNHKPYPKKNQNTSRNKELTFRKYRATQG